MRDLTERQKQILDFIVKEINSVGFPPSMPEIQQKFSFKSPKAVQDHLRALEQKGCISRQPHKSRSIKILSLAEKRIRATYYQEYPDLKERGLSLEELLKAVEQKHRTNKISIEVPKNKRNINLIAEKIDRDAWEQIYQKIEKENLGREICSLTVRFTKDKRRMLRATIDKIEFYKLKKSVSKAKCYRLQKKPAQKSSKRPRSTSNKNKPEKGGDDACDSDESPLKFNISKTRSLKAKVKHLGFFVSQKS